MTFKTAIQQKIHESVNGDVAMDTTNIRYWVGVPVSVLGRVRSVTPWTKHYRGQTQYMCTIAIQCENDPNEWISVFTGEETEFTHWARNHVDDLGTFKGKYKKVNEYPKNSGRYHTVLNWVKAAKEAEPANQEDWEDEGRKHETRMKGEV